MWRGCASTMAPGDRGRLGPGSSHAGRSAPGRLRRFRGSPARRALPSLGALAAAVRSPGRPEPARPPVADASPRAPAGPGATPHGTPQAIPARPPERDGRTPPPGGERPASRRPRRARTWRRRGGHGWPGGTPARTPPAIGSARGQPDSRAHSPEGDQRHAIASCHEEEEEGQRVDDQELPQQDEDRGVRTASPPGRDRRLIFMSGRIIPAGAGPGNRPGRPAEGAGRKRKDLAAGPAKPQSHRTSDAEPDRPQAGVDDMRPRGAR